MMLIILSMLIATSVAAPAAQSLTFHDDGSYRFFYETGKEGGSHTRTEVRGPDGVVVGKFSFEDPDGELREVNYRADETGFVAKGDVGVKGAPKDDNAGIEVLDMTKLPQPTIRQGTARTSGQFPVPGADHLPQETPAEPTSVSEQAEEPKEENTPQQNSEEVNDQPPAAEEEPYNDETEDKDEMQDLALEESAADDPPEAFPPGFFSEKLTNLRRLPEPTKDNNNNPATTETAAEGNQQSEQPESAAEEEVRGEEEMKAVMIETTEKDAADDVAGPPPAEGTVYAFSPLKPFPAPGPEGEAVPDHPHHEWASSMFHQPVYVFAYHQPDSYGYHYYF